MSMCLVMSGDGRVLGSFSSQFDGVVTYQQCYDAAINTGNPDVGYVLQVLEPSDLPATPDPVANPFELSAADALIYSGAICALWATAWAVKAVRKAL